MVACNWDLPYNRQKQSCYCRGLSSEALVPSHSAAPVWVFVLISTRVPLTSESDGFNDNLILRRETGSDLYGVSVVMADADRDELDTPITDNPDTQTLLTKEQRIRRNRGGLRGGRQWQMHKYIGSRKQESLRILNVHLDPQCARERIDGSELRAMVPVNRSLG